jgi:signal transduction histidine kinase
MKRVRRRLPGLLLAVGATAIVITVPLVLTLGTPAKELPWVAGMAIFVGAAAFVRHRRPDDPVARWFALTAGIVAVVQLLDGVILHLGSAGSPEVLAWALLPYQLVTIAAVAAIARLIGLFPDGRVQHRYERRMLDALWWLLLLPPIALLSGSHLVVPSYHQLPAVANPLAAAALAPLGSVATGAIALAQGGFALGVVLLVLRYRRAAPAPRRQMRWLLLPALLAASVAVLDLAAWRLVADGAPTGGVEVLVSVLWIAVLASLPLSIAVAILRPDALDVDRVLRKSLVYGVLWAIIAAVYVGAAAGLGLAMGQRLPIGTAIAIAVAATLVFQPARHRLERVADRWVFGARADPSRLVTQLGAALEHTVELERLLPRMADTLQEGLGLRWAKVRLEPAPPDGDDDRPALSVPIVLEDEELGVVECGPKAVGHLTADDEAVVATFARQAALAVRNVRLTAELEASRARLVRAQDAERRRLERNIHDGVQQDLVALTGHAAHVRSELRRDPAAGDAALAELQEGLRRMIGEIRELAHGIHPSILSDRGLLEAVEALAARSAIPVSVRADGELRGQRFAEEIEGAGYFTVAEALANASKHAGASHVEVRLARTPSSLRIAVDDDGDGFDPRGAAGGEGLRNLAERLAALGGRLDVSSAPGRGTSVAADLRIAGA